MEPSHPPRHRRMTDTPAPELEVPPEATTVGRAAAARVGGGETAPGAEDSADAPGVKEEHHAVKREANAAGRNGRRRAFPERKEKRPVRSGGASARDPRRPCGPSPRSGLAGPRRPRPRSRAGTPCRGRSRRARGTRGGVRFGMTTLAPRTRPSSRPGAGLSVARAVVLGMLASGQTRRARATTLYVISSSCWGPARPAAHRAVAAPERRRRVGDVRPDADHVEVEVAEERRCRRRGSRRSGPGCRP